MRPFKALLDSDRWVLTLLCALLYVPGLTAIPPLDRDEARFAQASKQMLERGDFIAIYFQDQPRAKKPAGIHWLQAAAVRLLGDERGEDIWPYRVPSVLGAWVAVQLTVSIGRLLFTRAAAFWAAALLAGCVNLVIAAHVATTDAALLAAIAAAQWVLATAYVEARRAGGASRPLSWPRAVVFWSALGIGMLIKGPAGIVVALLVAVSLSIADRDWRWLHTLRPLPGVFVLAAWVLPWSLAVTALTDTQLIARALSEDVLAKVWAGQEGHGAPPGYHLVAAILFLWPASLLVPPALVAAWQARQHPGVRFCFAWLIPTWLLFELIATKLPHYVLATYPALTLLTGAALAGAVPAARAYAARAARVWVIVWLCMTVAVATTLCTGGLLLGGGGTWWPLLAGGLMLLAGALPAWLALRSQPRRAAAAAIATAALATAVLAQIYVPRLQRLWISPAIAAAVRDAAGGRPAHAVAVDFHEPSLVFLLGTDTLLTDAVGAAQSAATHPRSVVIVGRSAAEFLAELSRLGGRAELLKTIQGMNYSKGRELRLKIFLVNAGDGIVPSGPGVG